jgi:ADP-ribosylglycohydrolase
MVPSPALMVAILDRIAWCKSNNIALYIHCWGGVGRTGTVIACWLMREGLSPRAALYSLNERRKAAGLRRESPDFHAQIDFVEQWVEPDPGTRAVWLQWRDMFRGGILGAALGNAIGVTNDMRNADQRTRLDDLQGGGIFSIVKGGWTDETAMMLCVTESLVHMRRFDARDVADRFLRWWREGYRTCNGRVYEVGSTTRMALFTYLQTGDPLSGISSPTAAGNGSVTRVVPVALFYAHAQADLLRYTEMNSKITHGNQLAIDACRYTAWLIGLLSTGVDKKTALLCAWPFGELAPDIARVIAGSYRTKSITEINTSIDMSETLEAALWAFWHCDDFAAGAIVMANLGGLSEAGGQLYGEIAGVYFGESQLPAMWLDILQKRDEIAWMAEELLRTTWKNRIAVLQEKGSDEQ